MPVKQEETEKDINVLSIYDDNSTGAAGVDGGFKEATAPTVAYRIREESDE